VISARSIVVLLSLAVLATGTVVNAADVQTITHGREVDFEDHLVPGKYVLFDFYADWCGPCYALEPRLLDLAGRHSDRLALRKIDIINWDSAVARQYGLSSIPYLALYGPDGQRIAAGDAGSVVNRLISVLGEGDGLSAPDDRRGSMVPLLAIAAVFAVAVGLVARKRLPPKSTTPAAGNSLSLFPVDTTAKPGDPAIWFALLQGSLEGPFTCDQLGEFVRRGALNGDSEVRRRGDASWSTLGDVLD
jgi:thioredoxin 1